MIIEKKHLCIKELTHKGMHCEIKHPDISHFAFDAGIRFLMKEYQSLTNREIVDILLESPSYMCRWAAWKTLYYLRKSPGNTIVVETPQVLLFE